MQLDTAHIGNSIPGRALQGEVKFEQGLLLL